MFKYDIITTYRKRGDKNMKLSFKYVIKKTNDKNLNIVKDLIWHSEKVSNMLLYEIRENKRDIENIKNLNIELSKIYT